jgi:hypothetical protein
MLGMHCPGRATHYAPDEANNAAGCCNTTACSLQCRTGSLESYDQQFVCLTLHTQAPHSVQVLAQTPDTELYSWCPALCRHMHHDRPSQHHACGHSTLMLSALRTLLQAAAADWRVAKAPNQQCMHHAPNCCTAQRFGTTIQMMSAMYNMHWSTQCIRC